MYIIYKYILPSKGDEKVLESVEMPRLDNGGWWCYNNRRDRKRSPSGGEDTAFWFGHVEFSTRAWCPGRRANEYTAGNVGMVLRNEVSARKRVGNSYVYMVVKTMELKQVFQGMYIERGDKY